MVILFVIVVHQHKSKDNRQTCDNRKKSFLLCISRKILARTLINRLVKHAERDDTSQTAGVVSEQEKVLSTWILQQEIKPLLNRWKALNQRHLQATTKAKLMHINDFPFADGCVLNANTEVKMQTSTDRLSEAWDIFASL